MSRSIGVYPEDTSVRESTFFAKLLDLALTTVLTFFVLGLTLMFYYYGQTLEQHIKKIDDDRFVVECELKQLETASRAIHREQVKLRELTQKLAARRRKRHRT
ncbi:hypothetical protein IV102_30195 [bacterium]|nr:hypothetical protein [bacterium]